jgi:hypothetical protein
LSSASPGPSDPDPTNDLSGNARKRKNGIRKARADDKAGHAPDDRTRFILREDLPTSRLDRLAPAEPILTHSREDNG